MTIPFERTRALVQTKEFLERLLDPKATPRVPKAVRAHARMMLRHYPSLFELEQAHKALPDVYGPVPPFSRLPMGTSVDSIVEACQAAKQKQ